MGTRWVYGGVRKRGRYPFVVLRSGTREASPPVHKAFIPECHSLLPFEVLKRVSRRILLSLATFVCVCACWIFLIAIDSSFSRELMRINIFLFIFVRISRNIKTLEKISILVYKVEFF